MTARGSAALVALATVAAYAGAAGTAWQYDDFRVVVIDGDVHSWSAWWASMPGMRPLTKASYVANWLVSPEPAGFAVTGAAMHVASSLLVLALVRRWLAAFAPALPRPGFAALAAALVFALHPAQTEAVVYIAGRSTVLSSLATFTGLYAWERSREGAAGTWRAAALLAFAASLGAREVAWQLPFAIAGVAMHVASSLLVLALARRWLAAFAPALRRTEFAAVAAALVFALHPAQTEAVVYIAGRSTVLSSLCTLAALYAWERARDGSPYAW